MQSKRGIKHTFWGHYTFSTPHSNKVPKVHCVLIETDYIYIKIGKLWDCPIAVHNGIWQMKKRPTNYIILWYKNK